MLGSGINWKYLKSACNDDPVFVVAIERKGPNDSNSSPNSSNENADEYIKAIHKTRILGCMTAKIHNDRCLEIDTISTRSNHTGVGTNMMFRLLDAAREGLFNVCLLNALVSAMGFYMNLGFTYLGTDEERSPLFAIDLTSHERQPPRLHLQRESSNLPVPIDERPLEELELALLESYHTRVSRNINLDPWIEEIGQLDPHMPWSHLQGSIQMKRVFFIPGKISHSNRSYITRVKTYKHMPFRRSRSRSSSNRSIVAVPTYLNQPFTRRRPNINALV
jgi:N-acetylglutamate synthase-like GNAT family acetyltransferase